MLTVNIATLRDIRVIYDKLSKTIDGEPLLFTCLPWDAEGFCPVPITGFRVLTSDSRTRQGNIHKVPEMARRIGG